MAQLRSKGRANRCVTPPRGIERLVLQAENARKLLREQRRKEAAAREADRNARRAGRGEADAEKLEREAETNLRNPATMF